MAGDICMDEEAVATPSSASRSAESSTRRLDAIVARGRFVGGSSHHAAAGPVRTT